MTGPVFLERPWALWLGLGLAALAVLAARRAGGSASGPRLRAALVLRVLGLLLASVAAAGPHRDGAGGRSLQLLVAAAPDAGRDRPAPAPGEEEVLREAPSLARALPPALGARDPRASARLLAILDPGEPDPAAAEAGLRRAAAAGIPVLVAPRRAPPPSSPAAPAPEPPLLEGLALPPGLAAGVPFAPRPLLRGGAGGGTGGAAEGISVDLLLDGRPAGTWTAAGPAPEVALSPGPHLLAARARDRAGRDRGAVSSLVTVPGPPRALVLEEDPSPSPLARALALQGIPVTRASPGGGPPDYAPFSVVVLGAGAAGDAALEAAVRRGTGLLVAGHPSDARGLGRFRGSPLAAALPVFLPPPPAAPPPPEPPPAPPPADKPPEPEGPSVRVEEGERPGAVVSLFLLVDTSGSMAGLKLEMARRAADAAARTLDPRDRFGLLSFTDQPRWVVPPGEAGDANRIRGFLRDLRAGGNTDLLPALREVGRVLAEERTAVRHVIVMSDGETSPFGLRRAVEGIVAAGGTISTVGIGADYDARLLGSLSDWGGGRTFPAVDPATLPEIVTLDTRRVQAAGREAAKKGERDPDLDPPPGTGPPKPPEKTPEKPLPPPAPPAKAALLPADPCAVLEGLAPFAPAVPPEAPPAARQATTVALRFEGDRGPALVLGRHGLGRTGVLAADPADLAASEEFPAAAARILRSLAPAAAGAGVSLVSVEAEAAGTRVRFEVRADGVAPIPRVELLDAAGDGPAPAAVERAGARRFEVVLPAEAAAYRTLVVRTGEGDGGTPLGFFDPGPAAARAADPDLPRRVAAAAGAVFVEGALPPPPPAGPGAPVPVPAGVWVAVAAAVLLLADAILRRAGRGGAEG